MDPKHPTSTPPRYRKVSNAQLKWCKPITRTLKKYVSIDGTSVSFRSWHKSRSTRSLIYSIIFAHMRDCAHAICAYFSAVFQNIQFLYTCDGRLKQYGTRANIYTICWNNSRFVHASSSILPGQSPRRLVSQQLINEVISEIQRVQIARSPRW